MALVLLVSAGLMIRTFESIANCRAGIHRSEASADHAHLDSRVSGVEPADGHAHTKQHCRQAGSDSGRDFGRVRERDAHGRDWRPTGMRSMWRGRITTTENRASPTLQVRLSRFLPHGGDKNRCGTRVHLDRDLWPTGRWQSFRRILLANCGARPLRRSASASVSFRACRGTRWSASYRMSVKTAFMRRRRRSCTGLRSCTICMDQAHSRSHAR